MKKFLSLIIVLILMVTLLSGCGVSSEDELDYRVLVNKLNQLPDNWEKIINTVTFTNSVGDDVEVETKAYNAYMNLKSELEKEGIYVDLDSARRSVETQQQIMDAFIEEYGEEYARKTVAKPGYSEHHTGLALDLYLIIDGKDVYENEDMIVYTDIWAKIHELLPKYGFILRYLEGKEHITGYGYEPWHIRYIDDTELAQTIMEKGWTWEEALWEEEKPEVSIDYGISKIYSEEDLREAAIQIKCDFAAWEGCELHSLRYAGDESNSEENIKWVNLKTDGVNNYTQVAEFIGDFHSPVEGGSAWDADEEYTEYQWWLARAEDGGWEIVGSGY